MVPIGGAGSSWADRSAVYRTVVTGLVELPPRSTSRPAFKLESTASPAWSSGNGPVDGVRADLDAYRCR